MSLAHLKENVCIGMAIHTDDEASKFAFQVDTVRDIMKKFPPLYCSPGLFTSLEDAARVDRFFYMTQRTP